MLITSGSVINIILNSPVFNLLGVFRTPQGNLPGVFVLGFQPNGTPEGVIVGVAPIPTGYFPRQANGTLRGGQSELKVCVYQYPANNILVQPVIAQLADLLAVTGLRISAYETEGETATVPYWELDVEGEWSLTENYEEVKCATA